MNELVGPRPLTALAGLAVSLAVSVAAWYYFDTLLVFVVLPFVPLLFRSPEVLQTTARRRMNAHVRVHDASARRELLPA